MSKNASSQEVKEAKKSSVAGTTKFKDVNVFAERFTRKVESSTGKFSTIISPRDRRIK